MRTLPHQWPTAALALTGVLALLGALGCEFEDRPRTVVDTLRVLGTKVTPPEVAYDDAVLNHPVELRARSLLKVSTFIVDPQHPDAVMDVSVIACTEYNGSCLEILQYQLIGPPFAEADGTLTEAAYHDYFTRHAARRTLILDGVSGVLEDMRILTFEGYAAYLREMGINEIDARLAILACPQGACPAFDTRDAYVTNPEATGGAELLAALATSKGAATQGALDEIAFARKTYRISQREFDDANKNPGIESFLVNSELVMKGATVTFGETGMVGIEVSNDSFQEVYSFGGELVGIEALSVAFLTSDGTLNLSATQISYQTQQVETMLSLSPEVEGPVYAWAILKDSRGGQDFGQITLLP